MIQKHEFSTGGYVIHKIMIGGVKHSAWFDEHGKLIDIERIDSRGRCYTVNINSQRGRDIDRVYGKASPARQALHNAVNRCIAEGAPVFVNHP
jgi:hypothetical protein